MTRILVVADATWVRNEVHAALTEPDTTLVDVEDPTRVAPMVLEGGIDLVIVDMQVGSMGGMAVTRAVREQLGLRRQEAVPVVMLLDRSADGFLAKRAGAAAWVAKPFTSHQLISAYRDALVGAMRRREPEVADAEAPTEPAAEASVETP